MEKPSFIGVNRIHAHAYFTSYHSFPFAHPNHAYSSHWNEEAAGSNLIEILEYIIKSLFFCCGNL